MDRYRYTWSLVGLPAKVKTKLWARRELHLPKRGVTCAAPPPWAWLMAVRSVRTISAGSSFLTRVATSSGWVRTVNSVFRRADWFAGCARGGVLVVGAAGDCDNGEGVGDVRSTGLALDWWDKKRLTAADLAICQERGITWNRIPRRETICASVIALTWAQDRVALNRSGRLA